MWKCPYLSKECYEEGFSLGYLSPRPRSSSIQLVLLEAEAGADTSRCPLQYSLLCNAVKRDSGGTENSWFCQAGWDWLRTLPHTTFLHPWSYQLSSRQNDPTWAACIFKQVLFAHSGCQNRYRCLVAHCVSPFPELSNMPAVLA